MPAFRLFPVFCDLPELFRPSPQKVRIRYEIIIDHEVGHSSQGATLAALFNTLHLNSAELAPERECISEIDIVVVGWVLFNEVAFFDPLLGFGQVKSLLEVRDQDDDVRLFTQIPFFCANNTLQPKHLQPIKGQPAQLHVRLKVGLNQLRKPPRMILVTVRNLNLNIQRGTTLIILDFTIL